MKLTKNYCSVCICTLSFFKKNQIEKEAQEAKMKEFVVEIHRIKDKIENHIYNLAEGKKKYPEFDERFLKRYSHLSIIKILNNVRLQGRVERERLEKNISHRQRIAGIRRVLKQNRRNE